MNSTAQSFLKILIAIVILAGATATIMVMVADEPSAGGSKILSIAMSLIFFGITGSICWAAARKPQHNILGNAGMIVSAVAFLYTTMLVLGEVDSTAMLRVAFCFFIASIALAHISFLFYINARNKYASIVRVLATLFITFFSLLIITKIFEVDDGLFFMRGFDLTYIRLVFSSLILDLTATLLVPLCNQLDIETPTVELEIGNEPSPVNEDQRTQP
jgi:hypothetical protein